MKKLVSFLVPILVSLLMRFLRLTNRFKFHKLENLEEAKTMSKNKNYILAVWHQNLVGTILTIIGGPFISMASKSKDGDIAANSAQKLGITPTRGSSSRGGKAAMNEMIKLISETGYPAGLTIDGPRGPAHEPKRGVFKIAFECKIPIIPYLAISNNHKVFERSWDKFRLPKPFGTLNIYYGKPFMVESLDEAELDKYSEILKQEQNSLFEEASKLL